MNKILDYVKETIKIEATSIANLENFITADFEDTIKSILECKGKLIVTGMGKSGHVANKIAATLASTGTPSFYLHPAEAFHGDLGMISSQDIVLAISNSGETDEILKIIPFIKDNNIKLVSISSNPESSLSRSSDYYLCSTVSREACPLDLAPTTSTTAQMVIGDALAVALMKVRKFQEKDFAKFHPGGSLGRRLLLKVENVMRSNDLPIISPESGMTEVVMQLSEGRLGLVIIKSSSNEYWIATDGDVRRAMHNNKETFFSLRAEQICSKTPISIKPNAKLIEAEKLMTDCKINALLVLDENKDLCGVVQIYDLKI